jgi:hypothetical protein
MSGGGVKRGRAAIGHAVRITVQRGSASFKAWLEATPAEFRDRVSEADEIVVSARWPTTAGAVMVKPVAFDPQDERRANAARRSCDGGRDR